MNKKLPKLSLAKETLRTLDLRGVAAGGPTSMCSMTQPLNGCSGCDTCRPCKP
jgi:hypothetical protein